MAWFRDVKTLQKFTSAHALTHNHFNHDRHHTTREMIKENLSTAWAGSRQLAV